MLSNRFPLFQRVALAVAFFVCSASASAGFIAVGHPNIDTNQVEGFIFVFGSEGTTGTATSNDGFNESFTIDASGVVQIDVPVSQFLDEDDTVLDKAIIVEADNPISGYFLNRRPNSTDQTFLFDTEGLGTTYRIMSWDQSFGEGLQFSITAVEDGTSVTVTPSVDLISGQAADTPFNVTLDAGQSVKYVSDSGNDPTGSLVEADKPVAVFAGSACSNVPPNIAACDQLFSQIPSVDNYSSEFIVPETPNTGGAGNVVRILAGTDNTDVTVNGSVVATLGAGEFHQVDPAMDLVIESSNPVLVGQYLKGTIATGDLGDPAFSIVTGLDSLLSAYAYTTPVGSASFADNFLTLAVPTESLGSLMLDGASVDTSGFASFGSTGFSIGRIPVAVGAGFIEADVPFVASVTGFDDADSYHTIIGATFSPGASPDPDPDPDPPMLDPISVSVLTPVPLVVLLLSALLIGLIRLR